MPQSFTSLSFTPSETDAVDQAYGSIDVGDRAAPIVVRVNRRARRLIVKVDALSGSVVVTAPSKRAIPEAVAFAKGRADWVRACFAEVGAPRPFIDGGDCPYRGALYRIVIEGGPRAPVRVAPFSNDTFTGETFAENQDGPSHAGVISVGGDSDHINRRLTDWLKREARRIFTEQADMYTERLGVKRGPVSIRDTRSRWGSCASNGALSFSWRLVMAPPWVLDYVAAHECAHLIHLDHSPAFWAVVRDLGFDESIARQWFRDHGEELHRWGRPA